MKKIMTVSISLFILCTVIFTSNIFAKNNSEFYIAKRDVVLPASQKSEEIDFSKGTLSSKEKSNAGLKELYVTGNSCLNYSVVNSQKKTLKCIEEDNFQSLSKNEFIVNKSGKVIKAYHGIVSTVGGTNTTSYMYTSLEDAYNQSDGIQISGAAEDGFYFDTVEYKKKLFVNLDIGGFKGYMNINDLQIVPESLIKSMSYYTNDNGYLVKYIVNDPINKNGYQKLTIDYAPIWMKEGSKYYSQDSETFYQSFDDLKNSKSSSSTVYFANLPIRSTSKYNNVSAMKEYLDEHHISGHTGAWSSYYTSLGSFLTAQNIEYINSLLLFSWANHESAYGTSSFAKKCNNYFGRGAFDSDPSNACKSYGYNTANDGILAQAAWMGYSYTDINDFRYAGDHLGNKASGINVYYASDKDWGLKIANLAFNFDKNFLDGKEYEYYKIGKAVGISSDDEIEIFKTSEKKDLYYIYDGTSKQKYKLPRMKNDSGYSTSRVIITGETSGAYQIQLPTPINLTDNKTCSKYSTNNGKYPKYDGDIYTSTCEKGVASPYANYSEWSKQHGWVKKTDIKLNSETGSHNVSPNAVNNFNSSCPSFEGIEIDGSNTIQKFSGDKLLCNFFYDSEGNIVRYEEIKLKSYNGSNVPDTAKNKTFYKNGNIKQKEYIDYYSNGNENVKQLIDYDSSGERTKERFYYRNSSGILESVNSHSYSGSRETSLRNYKYYSNGNTSEYKLTKYYSNGHASYTEKQKYRYNGTIQRKELRDYTSSGSNKKTRFYNYNEDQRRISAESYSYSNGKRTSLREYDYYLNGTTEKYDESKYYSNKNIKEKETKRYRDDGSLSKSEFRDYTSTGANEKTRFYFYDESVKKTRAESYSYSHGKRTSLREYDYYSNGNVSKLVTTDYYSNKVPKEIETKEYESNGSLHKREVYTYNSSGKQTGHTIKYY